MRAEKVIAALLNGNAGVTGIVGARIYGAATKQETAAPLVIYTKQSAERMPDFDGAAFTVNALIDVLLVAPTYPQLKDLGEAVRLAMLGQSGTVAGVNLLEIQIDAEGGDQYEPQLEEFAQVWTFRVVHTE